MLLDRCITIQNMLNIAIHLSFSAVKGILECIFINKKVLWLIYYLSIIKELFDIVPRAVNAYYRDNISPPQLEQINTTTKHNRISLFDNVSSKKDRNVTIAIVSQNASSAVHILLCKILEGEVNYAK